MWEIIESNFEVLGAMPVLNIQLLLDGLFIGAIFALAAYGLALVWGVMNVKNLAQGDFVIMGGYIAWWMSSEWGLHPILGLPVAIVLMFIFGWIIYRFIISRRSADLAGLEGCKFKLDSITGSGRSCSALVYLPKC